MSVIIPTFRRVPSLIKALDGIAAQAVDELGEIVVVDNDDPPGCEAAVSAWASDSGIPVNYVRAEARGASNARNRGVGVASGELVVFCDDDVVPQPGWLAGLLRPLLDASFEAAAGRVDLDWQVDRPSWMAPALDGYLAAFAPSPEGGVLGDSEFFLTANAAVRRECLIQIGGMDPVLGPRDGIPLVNDDIDLYRRLRAAGCRVAYVSEAVVVHELPPARLRRSYLLRRTFAQGRSDFRMERGYFTTSRSRGFKSAFLQLSQDLRIRAHEGPWRPPVAFMVACNCSRFAGFVRESLASFSRDWEGHGSRTAAP